MLMTFAELEQARLAYLGKLRRYIAVAAIVSIPVYLLIVGYALLKKQVDPAILMTDFSLSLVFLFAVYLIPYIMFAGFFIYFRTKKELAAYKSAYKAYFVASTLARYFENLSYSHDSGMPEHILAATNMISTKDRYTSNDLTIGTYKGNRFVQADIKIEEEHEDSDGGSTYTTVFKGRWMVFEFPKQFNFHLLVRGHHCGRIVSLKRTSRKFEKIETESITFNKMFKIYAEDGFETFYLLQPDFIQDLEDLGTEVKGRLILCFADNKLHIGINNGSDSFEPPRPSKPIDEAAEFAKVEKEIKLITDFVDRLELSPKLFTP